MPENKLIIIKKVEEEEINSYKEELNKQILWLKDVEHEVEKNLKENNTKENRNIRISKRKSGYQYYYQNPNGKLEYIKAKEIDLVRRIVQRDYDLAVIEKINTMRYRLEKFLKLYDMDEMFSVYNDLSDARKPLIDPIIKTNEIFINEWEREHQGNQNTFPEEGMYLTDKGENVRSKSEKILADLFAKHKVPYVYEPRFDLKGGNSLFPDFALLNVRERKTIYWEHFGIVSDSDYAQKTLYKLHMYEKSGLIIGDDLLFSMESQSIPLDVKLIEEKIIQHLL